MFAKVSNNSMNRDTIRQHKLQERLELSPSFIQHHSSKINHHLILFLKQSHYKNIAFYYPFKNEVNLWETCEYCLNKKYTIMFPKIQTSDRRPTMTFFPISFENNLGFSRCPLLTLQSQFQKNKWDIYEPLNKPDVQSSLHIDLMLIPGLAFDAELNRLGYGGGYYDTFLNQPSLKPPHTIGIFFSMQKVDSQVIVTQDHDLILNRIITEEGVLNRGL